MRYISVAAAAMMVSVTGIALEAQGSATLDAAARTMGGKDRVLAVRTLVLEARGEQLNFGQGHTPTADSKFEVTSLRRVFDFANKRWFLDLTREPRFITANMAPQRQRSGLDGDVAYNIAASGAMSRAGAQVATDRSYEFLYHPVGFLQAAYAPGAEVFEESAPDNMRLIRITPGGNKFAMVVDARTNLPARIERVVYQPMLGDVMLVTDFSDWQDAAEMKLPMRITQRYETLFTLADFRLTGSRVNEDVGNIAATDSVRAATVAGPAPTIVVDTLAPGVWAIAGQSHHTIAIEQSNQIVLVESPQSDARALAAIAKARELRPGKAPTVVINTHHHFDHAGGFRAAVSQGLTVITHQGNRDFYERTVFPRRHSIQQDALAQNPKPLRLMPVGDRHVMRDDMRTIEVYHVPGNPHSGTMLVVYLPAEKILIQADMYNPPAANAPPPPGFPFVANLLETLQRRGLPVDRVVGIHGQPVPLSNLQAAAAATRAP